MADDHSNDDTLLDVEHLTIKFFTRRGVVHAVRDVSFTVARGETLGLVGESGSARASRRRRCSASPNCRARSRVVTCVGRGVAGSRR